MSQAFQPLQHLARFDFKPYNTRWFCELDLWQQWNKCCRVINELSVQIIELEIYDGEERNSYNYRKFMWEITHQKWWHKQASIAIQRQLCVMESMYGYTCKLFSKMPCNV